ncbi:MAG: D-sedoheptulose-7-phosphate isomerase [Anaerolineae bacterium]
MPYTGREGSFPAHARALAARRSNQAADALDDLLRRHPMLEDVAEALALAYLAIADCLAAGGTLFLCGNGGSLADALHMSGEMLKSYLRPRPLPDALRARLEQERNGALLATNLERGLRAHVLGLNTALASAVGNDFNARDMAYAQELYALAREGDTLLGISTSGKAMNVGYAVSVARALGLTTISLTGPDGGPLAAQSHIAIRAPGERTDRIQEHHVLLYHTLCEMLEADLCG